MDNFAVGDQQFPRQDQTSLDKFGQDHSSSQNSQMLYVPDPDNCYSHHTDTANQDEELSNYLLPSQAGNGNEALTSRHAFHPHHSRIPNHQSSGSVVGLDQVKLDKKRERNRIAASKCRQRKLEKIQSLEEQVFRLKKENEDLRHFSERLHESYEKAKSQLDFHLRNGCSVQGQALDVSQIPIQIHPNPIQIQPNPIQIQPSNLTDSNRNLQKLESHNLLQL